MDRLMASIPTELQALFTGNIAKDTESGEYHLSIPEAEVEQGSLDTDEPYKVAVLDPTDETPSEATPTSSETQQHNSPNASRSASSPHRSQSQNGSEPPISEGETVTDVTIESLGEEGDGVATVGDGFVLIIEDVDVGDTVDVHIDTVLSTVAFGTPVSQLQPFS